MMRWQGPKLWQTASFRDRTGQSKTFRCECLAIDLDPVADEINFVLQITYELQIAGADP